MDQPHRIFYTNRHFDNSLYLIETDECGVQHLGDDLRTIVLDIHGMVCRSGSETRAVYAVHFGEGCRHNERGPLPGMETSNQAAELYAASVALRAVKDFCMGTKIYHVVLRTESSQLTRWLDEMVWIWERNGWKSQTGKSIEFAGLIEQVHNAFLELERMDVEVQMWQVAKGGNLVAKALAQAALVRTRVG